MNKLLVAGAGQMGSGIAQVSALAGIDVVLVDVADELTARALAAISRSLAKLTEKGKIEGPAGEAALARIVTSTDLAAGADADLFIEAVPEIMDVKRTVLACASSLLRPEALLATNTSSLSISALATSVAAPQCFIGLHFFHPVPLMGLTEVVRGEQTAEETVVAARAYVERVGKTPITVQDSPGFVVNRILFPMIAEAANAYAAGIASAEAIDTGMRLGANWPMGPLALADLVGLDTTVAILAILERELGDAKYHPAGVLTELVAAGRLGRKSGAGFYVYER